jgi:dTDP-glucose 4,6-dehydratase
VVGELRLLVTGGAGFIGSNFVRRQVRDVDKWTTISVLDALTYAGNLANLVNCASDQRYSFIKGNILDEIIVNKLMAVTDVVVHFAAESHVDRSIQFPHEFVETNVLGTHVLLKSALDNHVKTFIHVSTDEVYGTISEGSWQETDPVNPNSPYSASKAASDLLAVAYFRTFGMDVRVTRCSNNYGPYQYPEKMIPLFVTNLIEGKNVPLYGSGANIRDWLHVDDHCLGIELVIQRGRAGEIYNIGGGREVTNLQLTELILERMNKGVESISHVEDRKGHDLRYSVDISKSKTEIGYEPQIDFAKGLDETITWYQNNSQWWKPSKK